MTQARVRRARRALLAAAFSLPFSTTATAVEIHYARAIGDPYEYRPSPARPVAPAGARGPALPGLGTEAVRPAAAEGSWTWTRAVIGVLIVGAIAALANQGGGVEAEVQVDAGGGSTPPGGAPAPSPGAPSTGGGGGGTTAPPGDTPTPAPYSGPSSGGGSSGGSGGEDKGGGDNKGKGGGKDKGGKGRGKGK